MTHRSVVRLWSLPALAVLIASLAWVLRDGLLVKQQLKTHGIAIEATVIERVEVQPAKSGPCEAAVYRFTGPQGHERTGRVDCSRTAEHGLHKGSRVTVTYLPDDPSTHRPGDFRAFSLWRELLFTLVVTGSGLLLLLLAALAWNRFASSGQSPTNEEPPP